MTTCLNFRGHRFNYYNLFDLITTLKLYRCLDLRKVTLQVYGVEKELITAS